MTLWTRVSRLLGRRSTLVAAMLTLAFCVIFSLLPALVAPISADDRYWSIETPANYGGSYLEVIRGTWDGIASVLESAGRVTAIGQLARRLVHQAVFDLSHLTSTPLVMSLAAVKLLLLAVGVASCIGFLRALRWRAGNDRIAGIGRGSTLVVCVTLAAFLGAGVQTHAQFRNAWISYAPHTYLTVAIIFGGAAIAVTVARRVADRRAGSVVIGVMLSVVLAALFNWTYELNYLGLPLSLFALFAFPLTTVARAAYQRRARLIVGGTLSFSWLVMFSWTRFLIARACMPDECYVGTTLSLDPQFLQTAWFNLASSIPGTSRRVFLEDLERIGASRLWSDATPGNLWMVSIALSASLWAIWVWASRRLPVADDVRGAESKLLTRAAIGSVCLGIGGALIMSLSAQAQEVIPGVGFPYRHTVLTWVALSFAIGLGGRAVHISSPRPARAVVTMLMAILVTLVSVYTLPRNLVSTQGYRIIPANVAISDIHWEVVSGDVHPTGDQRRCRALDYAEETVNSSWLNDRLVPASDSVFRRLYGQPFCSTWTSEDVG